MAEAQIGHNKSGRYVVSMDDYDGPECFLRLGLEPPHGWGDEKVMDPEEFKLWRGAIGRVGRG